MLLFPVNNIYSHLCSHQSGPCSVATTCISKKSVTLVPLPTEQRWKLLTGLYFPPIKDGRYEGYLFCTLQEVVWLSYTYTCTHVTLLSSCAFAKLQGQISGSSKKQEDRHVPFLFRRDILKNPTLRGTQTLRWLRCPIPKERWHNSSFLGSNFISLFLDTN